MIKHFLLSVFALTCLTNAAQTTLTSLFSATEASTAYYHQGWDSEDDLNTWTYTSTSANTWQLRATPTTYGAVPFTVVEPESKYSLTLAYGSKQHEIATSPEIAIRNGSTLEFYCFANAGFLVYGSWKLYVIEGESQTLLLDQFQWAQDNAYDGARWVKYNIDLAEYAGKNVKFSFVYDGDNGEDEAIDGFRIVQTDTSDNAKININEGEQVHFVDLSEGATSWQWNFEGGQPATSTEQNPVVTYDQAGTYSVTLTTGNGTATATSTRTGYVNVKAQAPVAKIGMPDEAYLSPFRAAFVPTGVPVTFRDLSTGKPTAWAWEFRGTTPLTSTDQNPTVVYDNPGTYSLMLTASNSIGSNSDVLLYAVQAGGSQYIWNIAPEENSSLAMVEMGWYGNYCGTNWLGITEFAEHFAAPLAPAQIDSVAVYFGKTTCASTDADITLTIRKADENGMPGEPIAYSTVKAGQLKYDPAEVVETIWHFDEPVRVDGEFFVTLSGFPNNDGDDIAALLCRRPLGEKNTAFQYVLDTDESGWNYLDTGAWFENTDDPISLAVSPILNYNVTPTAISGTRSDTLISRNGNSLTLAEGTTADVYDLGGRHIMRVSAGNANLDNLPAGVYLINARDNNRTQTLKIVK